MFQIIFFLVVLILSIVVHEYSHGYVAYLLGDPTAKYQGRLTLNPIAHLDIFGSIILPGLLILTGSPFVIGWAKPVPYNPYNLRDQKYGPLKVALAGPGANFAIAIIFGGISRLIPLSYSSKLYLASGLMRNNIQAQSQLELLFLSFFTIVLINVLLAIFNLIPVPPLDGSKILYTFIPRQYKLALMRFESFGFIFILILLMFGFFSYIVWPIVIWVVRLLIF